jgi:hypothetical protein
VQRRRRILGDAQVLPHAAVVPPGLRRGAEIEETHVLVGLRVAQLDVGVEVDVVAAPHLARVVDLEAGRARGQLDAAERESSGVLVQPERCARAAQRRATRIVPHVRLVGALEEVRAVALQPRDGQ